MRLFRLSSHRVTVLAAGLAGAVVCGSANAPTPHAGDLINELLLSSARHAALLSGALGGIHAPLTSDVQGNLYGVYECSIRKVSPQGAVSTVAQFTPTGSCTFGAEAISIDGLAVDATGTLYATDHLSAVIRKITPEGDVSVLAGTPRVRGTIDGIGTAAHFRAPRALAVDAGGALFVADAEAVRHISPAGAVTSLYFVPPITPVGMSIDAAGAAYTMDGHSQRLIRIARDGTASVVAGSQPALSPRHVRDGSGFQASFFKTETLAADAQGNVYVGEYTAVRKVTPYGMVSTLARASSPR